MTYCGSFKVIETFSHVPQTFALTAKLKRPVNIVQGYT